MSRPKHSGAKQFSPANTASRNFGIALFGEAAWTEAQHDALALVGLFEKAAAMPEPQRTKAMAFAHKAFQTHLPRLLTALERQDAQPFKDIVTAMEAAKRIKADGPVHKLEAAIYREGQDLTPQTVAGLTEAICNKDPEGTSPAEVRRAVKRLGLSAIAGKRGRTKEDN